MFRGHEILVDILFVVHYNQLRFYVISTMVTVAQLVEHRIVIPSVAGSSPVSHPKFLPRILVKKEKYQRF